MYGMSIAGCVSYKPLLLYGKLASLGFALHEEASTTIGKDIEIHFALGSKSFMRHAPMQILPPLRFAVVDDLIVQIAFIINQNVSKLLGA
jgi:hypothetical protein